MPDLKKMLTLEALSEALPSWLKRSTKPEYNADEIDSTLTTNQFVTASDKDNWNAKGTYSKPPGGIPKSDLSSIVQTSLEKADSALQSETDPTVPSWAKQTNKPSYTQDEVPDGSTYKRVTQTEKDTWSGKQNALTTPQMRAVNSGINSTKVAQIETNKTNILYGLQTGVKNIIRLNPGTYTNNVATFTVNNDGEVTVNSGSAGTSAITIGEFELPAGDYKYWYDVTASTGKCDVRLMNGATRLASEFTLSSATTIHADVYSYAVNSNTVIKPMLCTANAWAQEPNVYRPPALPNYDLTRLESEDRAGLIECVDGGAKNLLQYQNASWNSNLQRLKEINPNDSSRSWSGNVCTFNGVSYTVNSDGTISTSGTASSSESSHFTLIDFGSGLATSAYVGNVLSGCPTEGNYSTKYSLYVVKADGNTLSADEGNSVVIGNSAIRWVRIIARNSTNMNGKVFKPMICTKAAFAVSKAFVPYRPSYDDALFVLDERAPKSTDATKSGGSMNDFDSGCVLCTSNVTGGAKAGYCFVRTRIYDSNCVLQQAFYPADNTAYQRCKWSGTWSEWKQFVS